MKTSRIKQGFTLIELLVVIAIIAILAAILFPVLSQARVAAFKAQSISNIKQIALAHMMYNTDSYDTLVPRLRLVFTTPFGADPRPPDRKGADRPDHERGRRDHPSAPGEVRGVRGRAQDEVAPPGGAVSPKG